MKLVDSFIFYNELEMLEYRLSTLYNVVDYFILVESTRTFVGKEKPLFYSENKERYEKYADKIIHVIDNGLLENPQHDYNKKKMDDLRTERSKAESRTNSLKLNEREVWNNEFHQRKSIEVGIYQIKLDDNDLIMVSDVDEIPDPNMLLEIKKSDKKIHYAGLCQDFYYYNLTYKNMSEDWIFAKIMSYKYYVEVFERNPQCCRDIPATRIIRPAGWHLSYFGDSRFIKNKIEQFAHQEFNKEIFTNVENIEKCIETGSDLFARSYAKCTKIPLSENKYLPPIHTFFNHLIVDNDTENI